MADQHDVRPSALDMAHHFSRATKKRAPNIMKEYYRFLRVPEMGNFAGGLPCSNYFPFKTLELSVPPPESLLLQNGSPMVSGSVGDSTLRISIPRRSTDTSIRRVDLDTSMQYGGSQGYAPLYAWLRKLANEVYHPNIPYNGGAGIMITSGSTDGLSKIYDLLFNYWDEEANAVRDREGLLVEEFIYGPPIIQAKPRDVNIVPIKMDEQGMLAHGPGGLFECLDQWDYSRGKRPHVAYLVPTGHNPTSGMLSLSRKRQIYKVCSQFDVIIIEDDPYWNLQYPSADTNSEQQHQAVSPLPPSAISADFPADPNHNYSTSPSSLSGKSTGHNFLDTLVPSFVSIDTDGRVIRLDTFSKTLSPGCRIGWITAHPSICEQIFRITDVGSQQPSGFSQAVVTRLIADFAAESTSDNKNSSNTKTTTSNTTDSDSIWGLSGWITWLSSLRTVYQRRMETMSHILWSNRFSTSSPSSPSVEMYTFPRPQGGMFLWLTMNLSTHPLLAHGISTQKSSSRLMSTLWYLCTQPPYQVLIVPGGDFAATPQIKEEKGFYFFRFCFAAVDEGVLERKAMAFVEACRTVWGWEKWEDLQEVLDGEVDGEVNGEVDKVDVRKRDGEAEEEEEVDREPIGEW